jgi:hypothetical protein
MTPPLHRPPPENIPGGTFWAKFSPLRLLRRVVLGLPWLQLSAASPDAVKEDPEELSVTLKFLVMNPSERSCKP